MDSNIIERVGGWETRPVSDGYAGLARLADEEFSGAVTGGEVWAFMLNGRVIGLFDGSMSDFEGAALTAHAAPDPALSLLSVMQERGGERRAKYYTNETPLEEADETLSSGGFTGFLELSENVLSGDYYVVYYGGRSLSVAFVGNNETLRSGDEAFELANDEVGIYEVYDSEITVHEIPDVEPEPDSDPEPEADANAESDVEADASDDVGATAPEEPAEPAADAPDDGGTRDATESAAGASEGSATDEPAAAADGAEASSTATEADDPRNDVTVAASDVGEADSGPDAGGEPATPSESRSEATDDADDAENPDDTRAAGDDDQFSEEERWRETRVIPSLAPDESGGAVEAAPTSHREEATRTRQPGKQRAEANERMADLESALEEARTELDELRNERNRLADARDEALAERDELREEVARLRERIDDLESERDRLESEFATTDAPANGESAAAGRSMTPQAALDGTNLFVRYRSKSAATLEEAYSGRAGRDEVNENLSLEHHTEFETSDLTVDGRPFEEFLRNTVEYGFVRWLIEDLLYEIRETGNERTLDELFAVIPRIDRAELKGSATLSDEEGEGRTEQSFDVVLRDRMGNPLVVADLNDSRDPATGGMMTSLIEGAERVGEANEELGAAFFVTASFFEPDALEAAAAETGGGLFGRGKRKSFVKLSRKRGFHLSLVETRNDEFHMNVPEL